MCGEKVNRLVNFSSFDKYHHETLVSQCVDLDVSVKISHYVSRFFSLPLTSTQSWPRSSPGAEK